MRLCMFPVLQVRLSSAGAPACSAHPAGFPQLYFYMIAQRRKVLRSGRSSSASKLKHQ